MSQDTIQDIHTSIENGSLLPEHITESNFRVVIVALLEYGHMSEFFDMTSAQEYPYSCVLDRKGKRFGGIEDRIKTLYSIV